MHISHDFIATKTCPSYEFLVVYGQVRVWDRKSFSNSCGAGADTKFQPAQDSNTHKIWPRGRPRTRWRDYISDLAWSYLGIEQCFSAFFTSRHTFRRDFDFGPTSRKACSNLVVIPYCGTMVKTAA